MTDEPTRPLTTGQVARRFGVHPATVWDWAETGKLPHFRTPGGHRRFHVIDVERLLEAERTEASA